MASAFSHGIVAAAIGTAVPANSMSRALLLTGVLCAAGPDLDWIGFQAGVPYGALWGHRGMTHSLLFAGIVAGTLTAIGFRKHAGSAFLYLFVCAASHGVLDAMTNGGLGIAFFSPFDTTRYFFPFRPIEVSPMSIPRFFQDRGVDVLVNEAKWLWVPSLVFAVLASAVRRLRRAK